MFKNKYLFSRLGSGCDDPIVSFPSLFLFQNVTSNHRSNDIIAAEDGPQLLVGRFMYGPLDMVALTGEKVTFQGHPSLSPSFPVSLSH